MTSLFLSDVHLRDGSSVKTKLVVRFLEEVASKYSRIFILGDLFDSWPGTTEYLIATFKSVIQALQRLSKNGHRIYYIEGNHDFRLGEFFTKELGISVYPSALVENFGDRRVYLAHGDLGNPRELAYRMFRYVLRRNVVHQALGLLPQKMVYEMGLRGSKLSRDYRGEVPKHAERVRSIYRRTACRLFEQGFDVVVMGHTHLPDDYHHEVAGRKCRYINTGDWVTHFTYLEFDGVEFYTRTHPVKNL